MQDIETPNVNIHEVKNDVELLKRDVSNIQGILTKLETAIDKITGVSHDIGKILSAQEARIDNNDHEIKERKRLSEKEVELLHGRITQKEHELKNEIERNHAELMNFLKEHDDRSRDAWKSMEDRVSTLEKWKWYVVGIASVVGVAAVQVIQRMI